MRIPPRFLDPFRDVPCVRADFIERINGVAVDAGREEVLDRLRPHHAEIVSQQFGVEAWWQAEQVHGNRVELVEGGSRAPSVIAGVDGLVTRAKGEVLGIYVADCGPIWLADRWTGAVGLLHSGKKGTEGGILEAGLLAMKEHFGTEASDVVALLGPCIRPPHYEVDFAAEIRRQAQDLGIGEFHDAGCDTASEPQLYYSYRLEKGRTGRMLALIMREGRA
jgi:copper oxidase (laccase) domain-containing protein